MTYLLLCPKEFLYTAADGKAIEAHKSVCVSGFCPKCKDKQARFFNCPLHKGDAERMLFSATSSNTFPANGDTNVDLPGIVTWDMFTNVDDEEGKPVDARDRDHHAGNDGRKLLSTDQMSSDNVS